MTVKSEGEGLNHGNLFDDNLFEIFVRKCPLVRVLVPRRTAETPPPEGLLRRVDV